MEESLGNPRDSLYFKGFHGTIYSRENGSIMHYFRVIIRKRSSNRCDVLIANTQTRR